MKAQQLIEKFINSCSHDLRAPVSSIKGLVRIAEHYPHHEETHKCLDMIMDCAQKMDKLIHSLEEYMIINQHNFMQERVNGWELADEVTTLYQSQLVRNSITVTKEINDVVPLVVDRYGVFQVLKHLLSNAVTFCDPVKENKKILIRITATKKYSSIEVADNGIGIPKKLQSKIYEPFYRGTIASEGLGMGLFLSVHLAEKMGTKLNFKSIENVGTHFKMSLLNRLHNENAKRSSSTQPFYFMKLT